MLNLIDEVNNIEEKKIEEKINKQAEKTAKLLQMQEQRASKKEEKMKKMVDEIIYSLIGASKRITETEETK